MADLVDELRTVRCPHCGCLFFLCLECDRDQSYCSSHCRRGARLERHRKANRKYQGSRKGRLAHSARQRKYRRRQEERKESHQEDSKRNKVTDTGSPPVDSSPSSESQAERVVAPRSSPGLRTGSGGQPRPPEPRCAVCGRAGRVADAISLSLRSGVEPDAG